MEIWAMCVECNRWFYCERSAGGKTTRRTCPVCGAEAGTVVDRAAPPADPAEPTAGG